MKRWLIIPGLLLLLVLQTRGQEVNVSVSAPPVVEMGERFRLVYTVNANPSNFSPPKFDGFIVLGGPSTSRSSNVQIINGKMTQSYTVSFTYTLEAAKPGKHAISPVKVTVENDTYSSKELEIEVVQGSGGSGQQQSSPSQSQGGKQGEDAASDDGDLFLRVLLSKRSPYIGEPVIASVKLYSKYNITDLQNAEFPSLEGFYSDDIEIGNISLQRENVNGQIYLTAVLKQYVLIPQRTGDIPITPFKIECIIPQRSRRSRGFFDDFFSSPFQNVAKQVASKVTSVNVKSLPPGKPDGFSGAVGDYSLEATINKSDVSANDAITLKVKVTGKGNLKLIREPEINFPPDFDTYDPKISSNIRSTEGGMTGEKTFEYLLIPRHAGQFRLPPVEFSYFDLSESRYKTLNSNEFHIAVARGDQENAQTVMSGNLTREEVKYIGKDIRFIKTGNINLHPRGYSFFGSKLFWLFYAAPTFLFLGVIFIRRRQLKERADVAGTRNRKANQIARKRLKKARELMKKEEKEGFYVEALKATWGYISDKLNIPVARLSRDNIRELLRENDLDEATIETFTSLLDTLEYERYAPAGEETSMHVAYQQVVEVISNIEQKLR